MRSEVFYDGVNRKEVEGRTIDGFSVFKKGIRPEWEDAANRSGSELTCRKQMQMDVLDGYWENLVLGTLLFYSHTINTHNIMTCNNVQG